MNTDKRQAYKTMAGCCVMTFCIMGLYSSNNIFLAPVSADLGIGIGPLSGYVTLQNLCMALFIPISIALVRRLNENVVMTIALVVDSAAIASLSLCSSLPGFYIAGAAAGISCSFLSYMIIPILITPWFEERQGTALAIVLAFLGIGGAVYNIVGGTVISLFGWRAGYVAMGLITLVPTLPCTLFLIKKKPEENAGQVAEDKASKTADGAVAKALKTPILYIALFSVFCFCLIASSFSHMTGYLIESGYELSAASFATSVYMIGITVGKFVIGILNDKIGLEKTTTIVGLASCAGAVLFVLQPGGYAPILVYLFVLGIGAANNSLLIPLIVSRLYDRRSYAAMLSLFQMVIGVVAAFAVSGFGMIFDATGNYQYVFAIVAIAILLGTIGTNVSLKLGARANGRRMANDVA